MLNKAYQELIVIYSNAGFSLTISVFLLGITYLSIIKMQ